MRKTVLIVEDDALQMKLVVDLLTSAGYETVQSVDGEDTLSLASQYQPDLIIMDLRLPMASGLDYTKYLKSDQDLKDIPVVAVTGYPLYEGLAGLHAAGCCGYLAKPISPPVFYDFVEKYIL